MNSQVNSSQKKNNNFMIRSVIKPNSVKKNFSPRSNTQEKPHYNHSKNSSSSYKYKNTKNINSSLHNNKNRGKEEFPKKFIGISNINISTKMNSDSKVNSNVNININKKNDNKNNNIDQFKQILNQKDKKILELEKKINLYKEKLKNQIKTFNINTSTNNFNLSKTRSSTNVTDRNMYQVSSLSSSHAKIKTSYPITMNFNANKSDGENLLNYNKSKSKNKKRPKSNNYRKPKINNFNFESKKNTNKKLYTNKFKRNNINIKTKYKNENFMKQRAKSSNIEKIKNIKNNIIKSNTYINNQNIYLLTLEETQRICDKMMERIKNVLELVKKATTDD